MCWSCPTSCRWRARPTSLSSRSIVGGIAPVSWSSLQLSATLWFAVVANESAEIPATMAFVAILMTQVVFWVYTVPVNRRTNNWTEAPEDWEQLRDRWEISHAASALLTFTAFVFIAVAILRS